MIKAIYTAALSFFLFSNIFAQVNIEKLGKLTYSKELSDVWSYNAPDSSEYALVGISNGLSIVDVTAPTKPKEVQFVAGANSDWRDIKTFQHYAYITNESGGGILIADLHLLPDSVQYVNYQNAGENTLYTAHNVYIDEFGFMYIAGHNISSKGVLIYDLNNTPLEPKLVGIYDDNYVHDVYVRDNIMYTSEGNRFAVIDVNDKTNWQILGTQKTYGYTHNAWLSDNGNTLFTTDETAGTWVVAWDVTNPIDIKELDKVQSSPGQNVIPHNTHVLDNYLITSYYTDGVVVFDASEPSNIIQVANFDTAPNFSGGGFNGCWGTTPFLNSGNILAADIEQGLYILKPTYQRAARLQGEVLNSETGNPINNVSVLLVDKGIVAETDENGFYTTGLSIGEEVKVKFSSIGYFILDTIINLENNIIKNLNVDLIRKPSFAISLNVIDGNEDAIKNADVYITDGRLNYNLKSDENGNVAIDNFLEGENDIYAGKWGYYTQKIIETVSPSNNSLQIKLSEGYYDDFTFDFGWMVDDSQTATAGLWERGAPTNTNFEGQSANVAVDIEDDFNNFCIMTGNGAGNANNDDVDNGTAIIESPEFAINYWNYPNVMPMLSYAFYFFNDGGQGTVNDYFNIYLVDGKFEVLIDSIAVNSDGWLNNSINIKDFIATNKLEKLKLRLVCADESPDHIVEAAFDRFELTYTIIDDITNYDLYTNNIKVSTSANPFTEQIRFSFTALGSKPLQSFDATIYNGLGLAIDNFKLNNNIIEWGSNVSAGMYHLIISHNNQPTTYLKFIKQ